MFDPLLAKDSNGGGGVVESCTKQSNLDAFQGPQSRFFPPSPPPQNSSTLKTMVIPPPSPSMALNNPVYYHVMPVPYQQSVPPTHNSKITNGSAVLHFSGAVPHSNQSTQSSITSSGMGYTTTGPRSMTLSHPMVVSSGSFSASNTTMSGGLAIGTATDHMNCSSTGLASPKTLMNNNYATSDMITSSSLPPSPQPNTSLTLSQHSAPYLAPNRLSTSSDEHQQVSYLHGSYRRETLPPNLVTQRTKMFENLLNLDGGIQTSTTVPDQRRQWQTFE